MRTISARDLKQRLDKTPELLLLNVLPIEDFEKEHIPGSSNIPEKEADFLKKVEKLAGKNDREIVVYCASKDCETSPRAARELTAAGFTNVTDFEGGMKEWKLAGFEVEAGAGAPV